MAPGVLCLPAPRTVRVSREESRGDETLTMTLRLPLAASLAILGFGVVADAAPAAPPRISFEERAVVVDGLAAGGRLALSGAATGREGYVPYLFRHDEVLTADATGTVRLELDRPVPEDSVWFAVDMADGQLAIAAPDGTELREVALPARALRQALDGLDDERRFLYVLVVRPAAASAAPEEAGAWTMAVGDGSESDGDGRQDGRVSALLVDLKPLGEGPPPPEKLAPGLVLVAVDAMTLDFYAATLAR